MKKTLCLAAATLLIAFASPYAMAADTGTKAAAPAMAPSSCEDKAVDKNGKKLAGAAKDSFMKKCEAQEAKASCEEKAIDKNGKKLSGAAKDSFVKKCEAEAKGGK